MHILSEQMSEFSKLYQKHAADVFRFALYLSGNRAEAEDITSETFVRVWTSPSELKMATVRSLLFAIARNLLLEGRRRSNRQRTLDESLPDQRPGPHRQAQVRAEWDAVLARLQRLPEIDRTALLLHALDGVPYEEIARALGISVASAKVKVHRARLMLAQGEKNV